MGSGLAAWAELYAAVGWRVFPAWGKVPAFTGWQQAASADPALIRRWWPHDDGSNVAAVAGEAFDCFDVEAEHLPAFAAHMRAGGYSLPLTPVAVTGRGGRHILTRPIGVDGTRRLFLDGVHIGELKSRGGLILVCPSVTEHPYRWAFAPADMALAEAPGWLRAFVADRPGAKTDHVRHATSTSMLAALDALAQAVARTGLHNRNNVLYWSARRAVEEGIPPAVAGPALARAAVAAGLHTDAGGPVAIERTLASAFEAAS